MFCARSAPEPVFQRRTGGLVRHVSLKPFTGVGEYGKSVPFKDSKFEGEPGIGSTR